MKRKLLVITAGTIAAGVGQELIKQVKSHPASKLQLMVRYIDTANLLTRYNELRDGEWFQMTIDPQFIDTVRRNPQNHPELEKLLYPGFLPEIHGSGGGSIRYNAAGAFAINRRNIKNWLITSITNLVRTDIEQVELSIALVVSSVGATGSGSLEQLIDLVADCAQTANIPSPLYCNVFILQPGEQGVTDLGLSNTLALYAEMAASRLSQESRQTKSYRGRILVVGWGSKRYIASIDQLKETAATVIRLIHDPITAFSAEYQEREVDSHVLREQDPLTGLPSHLSSANAVTLSLTGLEEWIIQRDVARLVDSLAFGERPAGLPSGEQDPLVTDIPLHSQGYLFSPLANFLQGEKPEDRYRHLLARLTEVLSLFSLQITAAQLRNFNARQQAEHLRNAWMHDKEEIIRSGRRRIQDQGVNLAREALQDIMLTRRTFIANGMSLLDLHDEYQSLANVITSIISVQQEFSPRAKDERDVVDKLSALERKIWSKERALLQAIGAVQDNLQAILQQESHIAALEVLEILQNHCEETLRNLKIVLGKLVRQRENNPRWTAGHQKFRIDMNHLFHVTALSDEAEIIRYADQVSIFGSTNLKRESSAILTGAIGRIIAGEQQVDQVGAFRKWLNDRGELDALFVGEIDTLLDLAHSYASNYVYEETRKYSVVDVLLQTGQDILKKRLREVAARTYSLIAFNRDFASSRREAYYVSAFFKNDEQRIILQEAIDHAFGEGRCKLIPSEDPTEIVAFYCIDGLPMSAISDLTGRCLDAFLKRRSAWYRQSKISSNGIETNSAYRQRIGVPVYSGRDAETLVGQTGVITRLYSVKGVSVGDYIPEDIPELGAEYVQIATGRGNLITRLARVRQFLTLAGFDCSAVSNPLAYGFLADARTPAWRKRFPKGLYVRMLFDISLDHANVGKILLEAKTYSDHVLVIIDQQPSLSGWMAIGGLRTEEKDRFVILPIAESLIKEGIAENKEYQKLRFYIDKHLGKDFDPYDVRDPVSDAVSFFGRENLIDEISNVLKQGQSLGLFGLHKMGKSSVLQRLRKRTDFPVAYVYLKKGDSQEVIYKHILEAWSIDLRVKFPNFQWRAPQMTEGSSTKESFNTSTRELLALLEISVGTPLLAIFLDEIDNILPYKEGDEATLQLYINLMSSLRGLQQETNSLSLLVAGNHPHIARRNYFWGNQKNPMYQVISERFLPPLEQEDCTYMIRSLGQQINLVYDDEVVQEIVRWTGAHPFLTRRLCSLVYKHRESVEPVSLVYTQKVARQFVSNTATASYFDEHGLWAELGQEYIWGKDISYANYRILTLLANATGEVSEAELCAGLERQIAMQALSGLEEQGIITISAGSKCYSITFGLFRDWIRLHKPFGG